MFMTLKYLPKSQQQQQQQKCTELGDGIKISKTFKLANGYPVINFVIHSNVDSSP